MYVVTLIRSLSVKFLNFIFGKTRIFIVVLGWFLVVTGALMLFSPEKARRKLLGMGFGQAKGVMLVAALFLVSLLASLDKRVGGILFLPGVIAVIIGYLVLKKKLQERMKMWFEKLPVKFLRIFACVQITAGALMLMFSKRFIF